MLKNKNLIEYSLLLLILAVAFFVRLYRIDNPVADWHSWRQADTASVSRNYVKNGINLFVPKFDDLSSLPSGKENPQGYRMVEFPVYNAIHALLASNFPQKSLEWWGRMLSILFSLGTMVYLYRLVKRLVDTPTGLLSAAFFGFLPYNIYFSRVILPEPMMLFVVVSGLYYFCRWLEQDSRLVWLYYFLAAGLLAMALLLKPFSLFLFLPVVLWVWQKWGMKMWRQPWLYLLALLVGLPFFIWRFWEARFPEGIPNYVWLFNDNNIRFKGAFFRWLFGERLGQLILGVWGLPLFIFGLLAKGTKKEGGFLLAWLLGILLYFAIVAGGNVRHDYYQIMTMPLVAVLLAKGTVFLFRTSFFNGWLAKGITVASILMMLAFSWYDIRDFYLINHPEIVEAGKIVNQITPQDAKVIAPYLGDTAFLYQTNRQGWPLVHSGYTVDFLISLGATHYVSVSFDETTKKVMSQYKVLKQAPNYVIVDLTSPK